MEEIQPGCQCSMLMSPLPPISPHAPPNPTAEAMKLFRCPGNHQNPDSLLQDGSDFYILP